MLKHLKELMAHTNLYSWEAIRAYHAVLLQQLENGTADWTNMEVKMEFRRSLVWHPVIHGSKVK